LTTAKIQLQGSTEENKKFWEELIAYFPWYDTGRIENEASEQFFYCWMCIRCRGKVFTEPLPNNDRENFTEPLPSNDRGTYIDTNWREGFMKYADEMVSGAMIYIPSFIKIGSAIQKLTGGIHTDSM
jgi:hypothetical protein